MEQSACALKISEQYPLIVVGCPNDKIYLYRFKKKDSRIEVEFLLYGHLRFPQLKLNSLLSFESMSQLVNTPRRKKEAKSIFCQGVVFYVKGETAMISVGYGRGNIITFDISQICQTHFKPGSSFKNFNVQRPVKEVLEKQLAKQHEGLFITEGNLNEENKMKVVWNKNIHGDVITSMNLLQNKVISMAINGEFRAVSVDNGETVAFLQLMYPLPSIWKL